MIASRLPFVAELFGRPAPRRRCGEAEGLSRLARALRPPRPLPLNDHLRRDIGLEPLPRQKDQYWPW